MAQSRDIAVLPQPAIRSVAEGTFVLRADTLIVSDKPNLRIGKMLAGYLGPPTGYRLTPKIHEDADNTISLKLDPSLARLCNEVSLLEVKPQRVSIRATRAANVLTRQLTSRP